MATNNTINNEVINGINNAIASDSNNVVTGILNNHNNTMASNETAKIEEAIASLKKAVAAVKAEMLSPRAIVRAIRDTMQTNETVAAFAARIGVTPTSNKKAIDTATTKLLSLIPYYTETRLDDNNVIIDIVTMQATSVEGVYVARVCKDIFRLLEAVMLNDSDTHINVKPGNFYRFDNNGNIEETAKVAISRKSDKEAAKAKRLQKAIEESTIEDIKEALINKFGLDMLIDYFNN